MQFPVSGDPYHTRCLSISVYQSGRDRVRFQGDIIDLRKAGVIPMLGDFQSAGIIHKMELSGEVAADTRVLERISGAQSNVAFEPSAASQGESCRDPIDRIQALVGERMDADFARALAREMGGPLACSHVLTLFQGIGSALPRALDLEREAGIGPHRRVDGERIFYRSLFVDGFGTEKGVKLTSSLSDVYTLPLQEIGEPRERLARHEEVRVLADVELTAMSLLDIVAGERRRTFAGYSDRRWRDRTVDAAELKGSSLVSGFAGQLFKRFGGRTGDQLFLDALLNLAPGLIQVLAALTDRPDLPSANTAAGKGERAGGGIMQIVGTGGREGSCYMWRTGSPLLQIREDAASKD